MYIGPFDTVELVTFAFSLVSFSFIYKAYIASIDNPEIKKFWRSFLLIALFFLMNRFFTNLEKVMFGYFFNILEYLSMLVAGLLFVLVAINVSKGVKNE